MADPPRLVQRSVRVYEVLIKAYPASFRSKYGNELTQVFGDLATDALRQRGAMGLMTVWFRVLGDLVTTAPEQHLLELQGRNAMKTSALAIVSVILAAIVYYFLMAIVGIMMVSLLLIVGKNSVIQTIAEFTLFFLPALLTGVVLARARPFFMPMVTAPLGTMAFMGMLVLLDDGPPWWAAIGIAAIAGLLALAGCILATKASTRLEKVSVPLSYSAGTLAVLVCTSCVACVLWCILTGKQLGPSMRPVLIVCLCALLLIAAATAANLVLFAVRTRRKTELN